MSVVNRSNEAVDMSNENTAIAVDDDTKEPLQNDGKGSMSLAGIAASLPKRPIEIPKTRPKTIAKAPRADADSQAVDTIDSAAPSVEPVVTPASSRANSPQFKSVDEMINESRARLAESKAAVNPAPKPVTASLPPRLDAKPEAEASDTVPLSPETNAALAKFNDVLARKSPLPPSIEQEERKVREREEAERKQPVQNTVAEEFDDQERGRLDAPSSEEDEASANDRNAIKPDFFKLRRGLRQLQFNYSVGTPYDDAIRQEFDGILSLFSKISVRYQQVSEENEQRLEQQDQIVKLRCDYQDLQVALKEAKHEATKFEPRLEKERQKAVDLLEQLRRAEQEFEASKSRTDDLKNEIQEMNREWDSTREETNVAREQNALLEAENSVLRSSLSEACDRIAEFMTSQMQSENMIQTLEDQIAVLESDRS